MGGLPGLQTGMIAQEVEKVFPEWVDNDPNGNKSIGFTGFEALMVEALRELKTDIDNIKAHVGLQAASKSAAAPAKASARSTKK